jgi:hypothetical protein
VDSVLGYTSRELRDVFFAYRGTPVYYGRLASINGILFGRVSSLERRLPGRRRLTSS